MVKKHCKLVGLVLLIGLIVCPATYADKDKGGMASQIEKQMWEAAKKLDFERAAALRDKLKQFSMSSEIKQVEKEMWEAAKKLDFERAAALRDKLKELKPSKKDNPGDDEGKGEAERKVTEKKVPKAALAALKKLARGAEITEFAEEIEYGHTFYEGSWKARSGTKMDVLVTPTGDLVEIEEQVDAEKVPAAALKAARKAAGKDAQLAFEKKTMILYEVKFAKGDSRHELLLTPDGRRVEEEVEKGKPDAGDEDDKDKKKDKAEKKQKATKHEDDDDDKHKAKAKSHDDEGDDDEDNDDGDGDDNEGDDDEDNGDDDDEDDGDDDNDD